MFATPSRKGLVLWACVRGIWGGFQTSIRADTSALTQQLCLSNSAIGYEPQQQSHYKPSTKKKNLASLNKPWQGSFVRVCNLCPTTQVSSNDSDLLSPYRGTFSKSVWGFEALARLGFRQPETLSRALGATSGIETNFLGFCWGSLANLWDFPRSFKDLGSSCRLLDPRQFAILTLPLSQWKRDSHPT